MPAAGRLTALLAGGVRIEPGQGGLSRVSVRTAVAEAEVYLQGAHLTHFRLCPGAPLLFLAGESRFAPGLPIRGGVPLVFPWFGAHPEDPAAPTHGFARRAPWRLTGVTGSAAGPVALDFALTDAEASDPRWPHPYRLRYRVTIGAALELTLEVENPGAEPFTCEAALHSYLAVGDVGMVTVRGLAGRAYLDKTRRGERRVDPGDVLRIAGETDRVYLDTRDTVTTVDPHLTRALAIESEGASATVVWNPGPARARTLPDLGAGEWQRFLCVETASVAAHRVTLDPGAHHRLRARLAATPA